MTKMELFRFLALLAVSFELAIADDLPASRVRSQVVEYRDDAESSLSF